MDSAEIRTKIDAAGYVFIPSNNPDEFGIDAFSKLGILTTVQGLESVQALKPRKRSQAGPNTYSGNFGWKDFPLHTDLAHWFMPPRYFALRCISGDSKVLTTLFDSKNLNPIFSQATLSRVLVRPRRPVDGQSPLLRVLTKGAGRSVFRWDSLFIAPASNESQKVFESMQRYLNSFEPEAVSLSERGDTLIIDNWRMLHGRSALLSKSVDRHLERAYIGELK